MRACVDLLAGAALHRVAPVFLILGPIMAIMASAAFGCPGGAGRGGSMYSGQGDSLARQQARRRIEALGRDRDIVLSSFASNHAGLEDELSRRDDMAWLRAHCEASAPVAMEFLAMEIPESEGPPDSTALIPSIALLRLCAHTDAVPALLRYIAGVTLTSADDRERAMAMEHPYAYAVRAVDDLTGRGIPRDLLADPASNRDAIVRFVENTFRAGGR